MNDFKLIPVFALASALAAAGTMAVPPTVDGIANYKTVHSGLAVAGVPSAEALASLKALGFKTVIDLRGVAEPGVAEEAAAVRAQGLRYVNVPVSPSTFSLGDVEAVATVLDDAQAAPVLLHCSSSNRVGAVWAVIQVRKGMSLEAAEAEGRKFGLKSDAMVEAMKRVGAEAGRDAKRWGSIEPDVETRDGEAPMSGSRLKSRASWQRRSSGKPGGLDPISWTPFERWIRWRPWNQARGRDGLGGGSLRSSKRVPFVWFSTRAGQ